MMTIFERYIFKNLFVATLFIGLTLIVVVFLTQSLRFLELVMDSGASSLSFWILTFLALPRFFEVLLPLSLMAAILFVYNRMASDSELSVVRSLGYSSLKLARPALMLGVLVSVFLWGMTMWAAPKSLAQMHHMRQAIKSQFSALFLREGVAIVTNEEGFEVVVYEGSRQSFDAKKQTLQRLNFERYVVDLPESSPVHSRWKGPDERTVFELLQPDLSNQRDVDNARQFRVELQRRIASPFLAIGFSIIACVVLLLGPVNRRGQAGRMMIAIGAALMLQSLFLAAANIAENSNWGLVLMYSVSIGPIVPGLYFLSAASEAVRRQFLYGLGRRAVVPGEVAV